MEPLHLFLVEMSHDLTPVPDSSLLPATPSWPVGQQSAGLLKQSAEKFSKLSTC
jgi:hypothetical protein